MLKLIIADDERVIRETISSLIDWTSIGIELVGLCKDGIEAYNMILDESPDIVMTDIRMPGLSGLELMKEVSQTDQQIQFVILSGYEDFEYAREAMKYGIRHYLLKPCKEEKIIESILQASKDCYEIKKYLEEKKQQSVMAQTIREEGIFHLLIDTIALEQEKNTGLKERMEGLEDFYGQYVDFYHPPCYLSYIYFLKQEYLEKVLNRLSQYEKEHKKQLVFYGIYVKNTLLLFSYEPIKADFLKESCGVASSEVRTEECVYTNLLMLLEAAAAKVRRYDTIYVIHNFKAILIVNHQNILPRVRNIYLQLEGAEEEKVKKLCKELLLMAEGATQLEFLKLLGSSMCLHMPGIDACSFGEVAEFMRVMNQTEDLEELRQLIKDRVFQIEELCLPNQGYGILAEKIMSYVKQHLSDKNLTLKKIAEQHLYMNVDYVSRQFRKTTGKKFSQYLTEERVKKAKELLMNADTGKIQYVAEHVGCGNNPQYFSQIFKKLVGVTPGKWATQMQNK